MEILCKRQTTIDCHSSALNANGVVPVTKGGQLLNSWGGTKPQCGKYFEEMKVTVNIRRFNKRLECVIGAWQWSQLIVISSSGMNAMLEGRKTAISWMIVILISRTMQLLAKNTDGSILADSCANVQRILQPKTFLMVVKTEGKSLDKGIIGHSMSVQLLQRFTPGCGSDKQT